MPPDNTLDRERNWVSSFLAVDKGRYERETNARQVYTTAEKAANEKYAAAERAAAQQYATAEQLAEQKYAEASKRVDAQLAERQAAVESAIARIEETWKATAKLLATLGVWSSLPSSLRSVSARAPDGVVYGDAVAELSAIGEKLEDLEDSADRLYEEAKIWKQIKIMFAVGTAIAVVALAIVGYNYYQSWSYEQKVNGLYNSGVAALNAQDWQAARQNLKQFLQLRPGLDSVRSLIDTSNYQEAREAIEGNDWDKARQVLATWTPGTYASFGQQFDIWAQNMRDQISPIVNPKDNSQYVLVPAGEFLMGSLDNEGEENEHPQHRVYLDSYWIMQTEVSNAQYALCVAAGACSAPDNTNWNQESAADHPVTNVTWKQAQAYAQWAGGRLPTEAEWEKAARGTDGRRYPWGNQAPTAQLANCCQHMESVTPVYSYAEGASPYGVLNMSGNAREWTADGYSAKYYSTSPQSNPNGPDTYALIVWRGGAYFDRPESVRSAFRAGLQHKARNSHLGFRVVALGFHE